MKRANAPTRRPTVGVVIPTGIGLGYSGPAIFAKRLMSHLNQDLNFRIYAGEKVDHTPDPSCRPYRRTRIDAARTFGQLKWAAVCSRWLLADAKKLDLVHFHGTALYTVIPALVCILRGIPYALVPLGAHDTGDTGRLSKRAAVRRLRRFIVGNAAAGFALGQEIEKALTQLGLEKNRVYQIGNPVSDAFFAAPKVPHGTSKSIVFVGSLVENKRPDLVLRALYDLKSAFSLEVRATFIGPFASGDYERELRKVVTELHLVNQVHFAGYTRNVAELLIQDRGVFVLLSKHEGTPGALVEAMAAGYPAVVTDAGAMGQIVESAECGYVVEPDSFEVARAIQKILVSEDRWNNFSVRSKRFADMHYRGSSVSRTYLRQVQALLTDRTRNFESR